MSESIKYGWLTDFDDTKFAPKSLFDYIYTSTTDKRNLTQWLLEFETALNNRDLQVDLASDESVKFSSPGAIGVTGTLDVNNGGLGIKNPTQYGLLMGNGTDAVSTIDSKAGFLISKTDGTKPLYSGIKALWESLQPDKQGPGFYIGFDNGDKRYYMGEVPLAASNQAGAVSTGAQTFEGAKTFNTTAVFKDSAVINNALSIKNNVVIQSGQLIFGNSNAIGQDHNNKFFITDNNDNAIFYVDDVGVHAINFYIDNEVTGHDTSFSETLKWISDIDDYTKAVNGDLTQEIADRKNSTLYVALGTANKTKKLQDVAIGVDGVLNVANGGTGLNNLTKNSILLGNGTSAVSLIGAAQGFLVCNSTSNQPHYAGISALWESTSPTTQGPTLYISFDSSNAKQYKMDEVPLASKNYAGTISTGAQEINGSKTFLSKTYFSSDVDMAAKATVKNDLTITSGNLVFGNGTSILGQSYTDKFFINDNNDKTIFYADATGLHAVEFHIKNSTTGEDTNFSAALSRITALEGRSTDIETNLTQEISDRKNSVLYVALGTVSTTKTLKDSAIGVNGTLGVGNGGTGQTSWTANRIIYASATNALSQLASGNSGQYLRSGGSSAPSWSNTIVVQVNPSTAPTEVGAIWITT